MPACNWSAPGCRGPSPSAVDPSRRHLRAGRRWLSTACCAPRRCRRLVPRAKRGTAEPTTGYPRRSVRCSTTMARVVAELRGLELRRTTTRAALQRALSEATPADWAYEVDWPLSPLGRRRAVADPGRWLVLRPTPAASAPTLRRQLERAGHHRRSACARRTTSAPWAPTWQLDPRRPRTVPPCCWREADCSAIRAAAMASSACGRSTNRRRTRDDSGGDRRRSSRAARRQPPSRAGAGRQRTPGCGSSRAARRPVAGFAARSGAGAGVGSRRRDRVRAAGIVALHARRSRPASHVTTDAGCCSTSVWQAGRRRSCRLARRPAARRPPGAGHRWRRPATSARRLEITERGTLENLKLQAVARERPGPVEVEIRVHATGLNFRDVLNALGMYPGDPGPLGNECAGVITAVGEGVDDLAGRRRRGRDGRPQLRDLGDRARGADRAQAGDADASPRRRRFRSPSSPRSTRCATWRASRRATAC